MESESRYRILVESSPIGIGIQKDCKWIYVNSAAVKIFNASSAEQVLGKLNTDFGNLAECDKEKIVKRIREIEKGVDVGPAEFHAQFDDGSEKYVHTNSVNITYQGEPAILTLLRDVTAQKIAEKELQFSKEELRSLAAHLQVAREEERTFIAREIHDELGQYLTGLKMDISFLEDLINERLPKEDKELLMERVNSMSSLLDTTVKSVRKIASELRPVILDSMGLLAAIEWLAEDFSSRCGIGCECFITVQELSLPRDKATAVFRILQESLTNVMRHAQAKRVTVSFIEDEGSYLMEIKDDGRGISEEDLKKSKSFGLLGMKERAMLFGGAVDIESTPGKGTTVSVTIPVS
jgi:PAS domain S-box-containing protein